MYSKAHTYIKKQQKILLYMCSCTMNKKLHYIAHIMCMRCSETINVSSLPFCLFTFKFKKSMTGDSSVLPVYLTVQQIIATSFSIGKKTRRRDFARFYNCYICLVCTRVRKILYISSLIYG